MGQAKRHHYVPQFLQRRFVEADGILHVYRKDDAKVVSTDPKNAFLKNRLYSTIEKDGTTDDELEHFFSQLESIVGPFTERILAAARRDEAPDVDAVEKENWDGFAQYQIKRVPDFHDQLMTEGYVEKRLVELRTELLDRFPERADEIEKATTQADPKYVLQNSKVSALSRVGERIMTRLAGRGLVIVRLDPKIRKMFVLGSSPIARMERGGLDDPNGEWWFPISPDVAIVHAPNRDEVRFVRLRDGDWVRRVNLAIVRQSSSFASS